MRKLNPGYTLVTIPKGTYPKQDQDIKVIGYATHIVASCKLPADKVYKMTKAIAGNTQTLARWSRRSAALNAEGDGRGYRRAVPSRRREVLQGSRRHREDATDAAQRRRMPPALLASSRGRASLT